MQTYRNTKRVGMRGFSLVEMLLVMAILSVVMMAVMSLYLPVQQSAVSQVQVTDVQSNLRLAIDTMTKDLLTAGFLMGDQDPIVFDPETPGNDQDFTIQTRLVGNDFARVTSASGSTLTVSRADMIDSFSLGSKMRLYEPISLALIAGSPFTVTAVNKVDRTITLNPPPGTHTELVAVRLTTDTAPTIQTIRYRFNSGALERIVNEKKDDGTLNPGRVVQYLARNISDVNFTYFPATGTDPIRQVNITLTGETKKVKDDAVSGIKTRELQTSVTLRNVF